MTTNQKARNGAKCHEKGACKKCPYREKPDIMFDPRIDPNYNARAIESGKKCRDELISDLAYILDLCGWA